MNYPTLLERFLTYVKVNTRSDEHSTTTPSTQSQVDFANNILSPEMKRVGLENVYYLPNYIFVYIWRSKSGIFKKSQYYFFTGSCNVRLKCDYLFADSVTFGTIC